MSLPEPEDIHHPKITISGLGTVRGVLDSVHPVAKFLNIPFGVLTERWRPADKIRPWQGVRDGTKNGYHPPQPTKIWSLMSLVFGIEPEVMYEETMSEQDCLSLNIFTPASALDSREELPVLVWIYGGGFKIGSITAPLHDCTELVAASVELKKPMIVVAINYRLNYFGYMSSKELALDVQNYAQSVPEDQRRWYDASVGNWGFLDQILGLEWIRDHIQTFGGDPGRVTIMGESAGGASISYLQLIPECRGLFYRAIMLSGTASCSPTMRPEYEGQRYFDHICRVFNIPAEAPPLDKVARLRAIPEKNLAEELNTLEVMLFGPTLDGVLFKKDSRLTIGDASLYDPHFNWVAVGTCADEASMFSSTSNATPETIAKLKGRLCAPGDDEVFDRIFGVPKTDADAIKIYDHLFNNGFFKYPTLQASEAILAHPTCRLTRYHFDVQVQQTNELHPDLKAHHGADLYFIFGNKTALSMLSEDERLFVRKVQEVWIEFVTTKTPEGSHLPKVSNAFPASTSEEAIVFGADLKVGRGVVERMTAEEVEFWRRSFAYAAQQAQLGRGVDVGFDIFKAL
ncbi:Cocaine esterase [Mortierella antarctica]|nr:Cocaine esterase [Mortierella antarctica]